MQREGGRMRRSQRNVAAGGLAELIGLLLLGATLHSRGTTAPLFIVTPGGPFALAVDARDNRVFAETTVSVYLIHPRKEVVDALAPLARGPLTWLPPDFAALTLLDMLRLRTAISAVAASPIAHMPLSTREHEVLHLVAQRYHDAQIAAFLRISEGTVKTNVARVKEKLSLSTREELIAAYPLDKYAPRPRLLPQRWLRTWVWQSRPP